MDDSELPECFRKHLVLQSNRKQSGTYDVHHLRVHHSKSLSVDTWVWNPPTVKASWNQSHGESLTEIIRTLAGRFLSTRAAKEEDCGRQYSPTFAFFL